MEEKNKRHGDQINGGELNICISSLATSIFCKLIDNVPDPSELAIAMNNYGADLFFYLCFPSFIKMGSKVISNSETTQRFLSKVMRNTEKSKKLLSDFNTSDKQQKLLGLFSGVLMFITNEIVGIANSNTTNHIDVGDTSVFILGMFVYRLSHLPKPTLPTKKEKLKT